jgi:hypothetical protein
MSHVQFSVMAGLAFGVLAVALMVPLQFPDKRTALTSAFLDRLLLSAPSAVITKAWVPILGLGALGGLIIALIKPL